jgi:hypothetical protein
MNERASNGLRSLAIVAVALILGACAYGRSYNYDSAPLSLAGVSSSGPITIGVQDARPYVTSGNKPEKFVGLMRGAFGNPFDVSTQSGGPLAVEMRDAVVKAMKSKGITASGVTLSPSEAPARVRQSLMDSKARKLVLVTLNEWKSDSMVNTTLHFDVTLTVFGAGGEQLASSGVKGRDNLGALSFSPNEGISAMFVKKFEVLFDDEKVIAALK